MAARGGDLQGALGMLLAADVGQIRPAGPGLRSGVLLEEPIVTPRGRWHRRNHPLAPKVRHHLGQGGHRNDLDPLDQGRLPAVGRGDKYRLQPLVPGHTTMGRIPLVCLRLPSSESSPRNTAESGVADTRPELAGIPAAMGRS